MNQTIRKKVSYYASMQKWRHFKKFYNSSKEYKLVYAISLSNSNKKKAESLILLYYALLHTPRACANN